MDNSTGEWNEYARLVLAELERHNGLLVSINDKLDGIKLQQALTEREINSAKAEIATLKLQQEKLAKDHNDRLEKLEDRDLVSEAIKKYRAWFITLVFTLVTSLILPLIELYAKLKG